MIKQLDDNSEIFFSPIPRWITVYGLVYLAILTTGLVFFTSTYSYPSSKRLSVVVEDGEFYAAITPEVYGDLLELQPITFDFPFSDAPVHGRLDKRQAWAKGDTIFIPVIGKFSHLIDSTVRIRGKLTCRGTIINSDVTLLQKIFKRKL
jgi:hypothetical protein